MRKRLLFEVASLVCLFLLQAQAQSAPISLAKVKIENVKFERVAKLSSAQQRVLAKEIRQETDWPAVQTLNAVADSVRERVLAAYADTGYWRAKVTVRVVPQQLLDSAQSVDVIVWALNEGRQYRLSGVTWSGVEAFPQSQVASLMPVRPGYVLERAKIAEAMESARRLYATHGYINYTAMPQMQMDDQHGTVALEIHVNEGGVFTFEKFEVVGIKASTRDRLLEAWPLRPGDVYASGTVEDFVRAHAAILPPAGQRDVVCRTLDLSNHTIDFTLDFRADPPPCSPEPDKETTSQKLNHLLPEP